ncbi:MAG: DUF4339 domain-containing protein [Planctomycetota bacterium]
MPTGANAAAPVDPFVSPLSEQPAGETAPKVAEVVPGEPETREPAEATGRGRVPADAEPSFAPESPVAATPQGASAAGSEATFPAATGDPAAPAYGAEAIPGGADPLAEAPGAVWYVRPPGGGQFGPAAGDVMKTWIAEDRVSPDSLVWREGWPDWQKASDVFPQLGTEPSEPSIEPVVTPTQPSVEAAPATAPRRLSRSSSAGSRQAVILILALAAVLAFALLVWVLLGGPKALTGALDGRPARIASAASRPCGSAPAPFCLDSSSTS